MFKKYFRIKILRKKTKKRKSKEYLENKGIARNLVLDKLDFWKNFYQSNYQIDFIWNKVAIKNSKTRWGSCSSKKNLNFSYKIIFLKEEEQDYLIVHELCHLQEMNHKESFWNLVSLAIPDCLQIRNNMKNFNLR